MAVDRAFDFAGFFRALDIVRRSRSLSWRQVAAETGVSASSITRFSRGSRPDVDTVAALSAWAGLDLNDFAYGAERIRDANHLAMAATYIRRDPSLSTEEAAALEQLLIATYSRMKSTGGERE